MGVSIETSGYFKGMLKSMKDIGMNEQDQLRAMIDLVGDVLNFKDLKLQTELLQVDPLIPAFCEAQQFIVSSPLSFGPPQTSMRVLIRILAH
jgi:hypothetical protein